MWGIWDHDTDDWVRELPSKVDDGGIAILAFDKLEDAQERAAQHYGYEDYGYEAVLEADIGEVRDLK